MNPNLLSLRLLFIITDAGTEKRIEHLFSEIHLPVYYQFRGQGTAKTEILDICGLQGRTRLFTVSIVPKIAVRGVYEKLEEFFHIRKKGMGVAVTVPVTGAQERILTLLKEEVSEKIKKNIESDVQKMKEEALYTMILVAVKAGYSDEVIEAATKAGAGGGTVIRGRRQGTEAMVQFLGISMQEEQDFVMIIAPKEKKASIMESIGKSCGLQTEACGTILSVPVDEVLGIREEQA